MTGELTQPDAPPERASREPARNLAYTYASTGLDLLYLATTVLVFPRIAEKAVFAEYRILLLYGSYAGFLHLGLLNGFYQASLHSASAASRLALFRKTRRILLGMLLVLAPLGAVVFALCNPTASGTTVAALLVSWFLLNGQTLVNYATQTQGRFDRFFAYNCAGRCLGIAFVCAIALSGNISSVTLDISFLLPIAVTVVLAEAMSHGRLNIYGGAAAPGAPLPAAALEWRSGAHLYAANVFASLALSADKLLVASQFARGVFADYSFAFSLSSLVLYAGDGIATATLPVLLRRGASDTTRRQAHSIWRWLYWTAPFAYWPATVFIGRWYPAYATCKPYLACFSATLPAVIFCKSYCGSTAIAARASHRQSWINLAGLAAIAAGITIANRAYGRPLAVCMGWGLGVLAWAALCSWRLGRHSEPRVRSELRKGLLDAGMSAAAFGAGLYLVRFGAPAGALAHLSMAALALCLPLSRRGRTPGTMGTP